MAGRFGAMTTSLIAIVVATLVMGCGATGQQEAAPASLPGGDTEPPASPSPSTVAESTTTVAPSTTAAPTTTTTDPRSCLATLPVRARAGQLLVALTRMSDLAGAEGPVAAGDLGGIVLLGSPPADLADRLAALRSLAPNGMLVAVDEEGGRVQRLRELIGPVPSARRLASEGDPAAARDVALGVGTALAALGIDLALAPVIDVGGGPGIGDRSFSDDPAVVTRFGLAVVDGLAAGGVIPVVKHFPGHGRASGDTHLGVAVSPPLDELRSVDLVPFAAAVADGRAAVMVSHLAVPGLTFTPGLTDTVPASLSAAAVTDLLRTELGFDGLVISDDLGMRAVTSRYAVPDAVVAALVAGVDLVIIPSPAEAAPVLDAVVAAVEAGTLAPERLDEAVVRVLRAKGLEPCA